MPPPAANDGAEAGNKYRLWFTEHALHGSNEDKGAATQVVSYLPMLQQALRDVAAWVEDGTPPPANSGYNVNDGQIVLASTAKERASIQPVVTVTANGKARAVVKAGKPVDLRMSVLPSAYGESVVFRILGTAGISVEIEKLGLSPRDFEVLERELDKPNGMILTSPQLPPPAI